MFQIETISAKMLDYYVERSDAVIIDLRDPAAYRRDMSGTRQIFHTESWRNILRKNRIRNTVFPKINC